MMSFLRAGPAILRDLSPPKKGLKPRSPENFLRQGQGLDLELRNKLKTFLQENPINR